MTVQCWTFHFLLKSQSFSYLTIELWVDCSIKWFLSWVVEIVTGFHVSPYSEKPLTQAWDVQNQQHLFAGGVGHTMCLAGCRDKRACPLVVPSEPTSVSLWGITLKPSAWPVFSVRGVGGSWSERDRKGNLENLVASWDSQTHPASTGPDHLQQKHSALVLDTDIGEQQTMG